MVIGVIGAGRIGKVHIRNISLFVPELKIKTIADPFANEQTEAYSAQFGIKNVTKDANDIFNDPEIEAVAICSSTDTHSKYIIEAAKAGKNCFCEKPIDYDLAKVHEAIDAAKKVGAQTVTIHSNALGDGGIVVNHYDELSDTVKLCSMYDTLLASVKLAEEYKIRMNLEGLNIKVDHVGNFLQTTQMAAEVTRLINSPYLMILFDAYHMQYNEGALCYNIEKYFDQIGHIHIADCPGRHEPGTGEINYHAVYETLKRLGYKYRVGYELFPLTDTATAVKAIFKD